VSAALATSEVFHTAGAPTATEVGRYTLTLGDGQQADHGKYVVIWQQESDGRWALHRDIWTSSQLAAPAA
jgi:ketosteroid isomerase-like protein